MNNKENYKNAVDQIRASQELKEKAFENAKFAGSNKYGAFKKLLTSAAVFVLILIGMNYLNNDFFNPETPYIAKKPAINNELEKETVIEIAKLPRFKNMKELKSVIKENGGYGSINYMDTNKEIAFDGALDAITESAVSTTTKGEAVESLSNTRGDYSTTNVQVENVDEADIIKTDGEHIYYVANNMVHIIKADTLEVLYEINIEKEDERFSISEIYLNKDKLILIGTSHLNLEPIVKSSEDEKNSLIARVNYVSSAKAIVYDIEDKKEPKNVREVALEGRYIDSRMIGENLYLISRKSAFYYDNTEDYTILPNIQDTVLGEIKSIDCTDIAYFEGTKNNSFMMVGSFNVNNDEEVFVETFFGAGELVYANEKNLYLTHSNYLYENENTTIYRFALEGNKMILTAQGEVKGTLNNQFSMDEYDGNLRVATTSSVVIKPNETEEIGDGIMKTTIGEFTTTNNLYILNENLEEIGKIENLANDERIYSVRFIGKIGYIVTFKQIDPLFVIDLSDPTNPTVKGELKIPGYSSYLHPYDENHIIGIGYNTKDNGHGGVTNSNMKMSMFDVSDLENPKEIFNIDIGGEYATSEIIYNHKALFYKKSEDLIGFPVTYREYDYRDDKNGFVVFKIDLEANEFKKHGEVLNEIDYRKNVRRVIYIEDVVYALSDFGIISYDLNTFEKLNEVTLSQRNYENEFIYETVIY